MTIIARRSKKQSDAAISSIESEFLALAHGLCEIL